MLLNSGNEFIQGCRSAGINLEARSLTSWSSPRHCVVTKLKDLTADNFRNIKLKAGALLIILPQDFSNLKDEDRQVILFFTVYSSSSIVIFFSTF